MPKYLWEVSYTTEGSKGVMKEGGTKRRATVEKALKAVGGKVEAFYYAFGKYDAYVLADLPDHISAAAISLAVHAAGAARVRTTVLISPEDIDAATRKSIPYRPPGK